MGTLLNPSRKGADGQLKKVFRRLYTRALPTAFRGYRRYLVFVAILFSTCIVVGYRGFDYAGGPLPWLFQSLVRLGDAMAEVSPARQIAMLFWNNLKVILISIALGWLLGIVPLAGAGLNGVIIGAGAKLMTTARSLPLAAVIVSFLPHGVFELPAFIVGQSIGLRMGFLAPIVWRGRATREDLGRAIAEGGTLFVLFVLPLLAIAAAVELKISPAVIRMVTPGFPTLPL